MRISCGLTIALSVTACGRSGAIAPQDAPITSCGTTSGSLTTLLAGQLETMDATRLFVSTSNGAIVAWSKVDGTIRSFPALTTATLRLVVGDVSYGYDSVSSSIVGTNIDDGSQTVLLANQPAPIVPLVATSAGEILMIDLHIIQTIDPGSGTARVLVSVPSPTSIINAAANDTFVVWLQTATTGQDLEKLELATGIVTPLGTITTPIYPTSPYYPTSPMVLSATSVVYVEGSESSWSLIGRSLETGALVSHYASGPVGDNPPPAAEQVAADSSNVYWTLPESVVQGPPMTCSTTYPLVSSSGIIDNTSGDYPLLTDDQHLYFSTGGAGAGTQCCGNNVPCCANVPCPSGTGPASSPGMVTCYTP